MKLKQKLWSAIKYATPIVGMLEAHRRGRPNLVFASLLYSLAFTVSLVLYGMRAWDTRSFSLREQSRIINQRKEKKAHENNLRQKLSDYIDKDRNGKININELYDFSKKSKTLGFENKEIVRGYGSLQYNLARSFELKELEKLVQAYEAKREN